MSPAIEAVLKAVESRPKVSSYWENIARLEKQSQIELAKREVQDKIRRVTTTYFS